MAHITVKKIESIEPVLWDVSVQTFPQSFAWGESRELAHQSILRLEIQKDGKHLAYLLVTLKKIPYMSWCIGHVPRSPLFDGETLQVLKEYCLHHKIAVLTFEPNVFETEIVPGAQPDVLLKKNSHPQFSLWSPFVDLTESFDTLEKNFSKTVRNETRNAQKNGCIVVDGTSDELFADFLFLTTGTHTRKNFTGYTEAYYTAVFQTLKKYDQARIFVGYDQDKKPVASALIFIFTDTITYAYAGSLGNQTPRGMMYLLVASIIQYGQSQGLKTLDLFGSLDPAFDGNHPWKGFTQFKKSFGPVFKKYIGAYDLVINKPLYTIFTLVQNLKRKLKK